MLRTGRRLVAFLRARDPLLRDEVFATFLREGDVRVVFRDDAPRREVVFLPRADDRFLVAIYDTF